MSVVVRRHNAGGRDSEAVYSSCERYRYSLSRVWDDGARRLLYVMLNPSRATEAANDPTIERCERRARQQGYGGFRVCNLFALRETDPGRLRHAKTPLGPDNDAQLVEAFDWSDDILCAWGVHGRHMDRDAAVRKLLAGCGKPVFVLGLTLHGHPRHPLYMPYAATLQRWNAETAPVD